jgi:heme A synthase
MSGVDAVVTKPAVRTAGWAALLAAALTAGLMVYGGWVRASGSGLGCPDWPLCEGRVVPELDRDTAIEYGHRLYAGLTMMATAAAAWLGFKHRQTDPVTARLLIGALSAILAQAVLGGITVLTELHGLVVMAHLTMAMATLAVLTTAALRVLLPDRATGPEFAVATGLLIGGAMVMLMGASLVGTGLSAGCLNIPFCDERSTTTAASLHTFHRALGVLLLAALVVIAVHVRSRPNARLSVSLLYTATLLMVGQMVAGAASVAMDLPEGLRVLHLGLATLIWWTLVGAWSLALGSRSRS